MNQPLPQLPLFVSLASVGLLAACGGGGSSSSTSQTMGTLGVAMSSSPPMVAP